jgi:hypothetical protein
VIEPFAGAAGYSCHYYDLDIVLIEKYPIIANLWKYLTRVTPHEIRSIPPVSAVDDLPGWVPPEARSLVGFWMCQGLESPRKTLGSFGCGWSPPVIERIASQVEKIRHWRVLEADALDVWTDQPATWFVDPPYNNKAGARYIHGSDAIDFRLLAQRCAVDWPGHVIVCENAGADWLPFEPFGDIRSTKGASQEVIYQRGHA